MTVLSRAYARYVLGLLVAINFFNYVDRMVIVTMYDDLRRHFHFDDTQLGAFWLAFFLVHALATFPLGWAADHFDRRRIIGCGVIAWSLATLGSAYAWGFVSMLFLRGAIGIGEAAYGPSSNAILCEIYPQNKARSVAVFNGGMFAGACCGLAVGWILGFPRAFQVVAIPGLALGTLVLFLRVPPRRATVLGEPNRLQNMLKDGLRALRIPTLRWMLPAGILISFAAGGYITWIVDFTLKYKHMTLAQATKVYAAITLTGGILGVLAGGLVADRLHRRSAAGRPLAVAIGFFASVPFALLILVFDTGAPYFLCSWLLIFFIPWYNGPMAAVIDDVVDDRDAATAQAAFVFFLHTFGTGPGGFVLGFASTHSSLRYAFIVPAIAIFLAGLCSLMAARHAPADARRRRERAAAEAAAGASLAAPAAVS
jgi:predicted MFS family arabinose efflux permease